MQDWNIFTEVLISMTVKPVIGRAIIKCNKMVQSIYTSDIIIGRAASLYFTRHEINPVLSCGRSDYINIYKIDQMKYETWKG